MVISVSKISVVYTAIIDKMEALYPAKSRLFNPYKIEENPEICRKDSWGIRVEEADREETEFCNISINRQFTAIFVRHFVTLAGKEDGFDAVTASLLEDQQIFSEAFFATDQIGQIDNIERIELGAISGIQEVVSDEKKYLFSEVTFNILISEAIS